MSIALHARQRAWRRPGLSREHAGAVRFYASTRFADLFTGVRNAPLSLAARLPEATGLADVQTTIGQVVQIELAGVTEPLIGPLIRVDRRRPPRMNLVSVAAGRAKRAAGPVRADAAIEALVLQAFAQARAPDAAAFGRANDAGHECATACPKVRK
ncbi:hypothetical protein F2P44_22935 [Massilia sp. CCM 8695]|uniref:MacB-like periplasmic core domain-containing protein n=1 Tax=Massilia frigida TaxID=2609281 RepID=A0ABX0N9L8_9BURK|nr:hypothetical protein [Massilia frigida]NHZ82111.1 hypothetical protein [Massilia frigida]